MQQEYAVSRITLTLCEFTVKHIFAYVERKLLMIFFTSEQPQIFIVKGVLAKHVSTA